MNYQNLQNLLTEKHDKLIKPKKIYDKNFSIMICDDDPEALSLLVKILHKKGIKNIVVCSDTQKVIKYLNNKIIPDILLLDIGMPSQYIQGDELVEKIRSKSYNFPVIAVTGLLKTSDTEEFINKGFNDVIIKPYSVNELINKICRFIN